ncbi:MAG: glycerol-3-phosphate dehydrogenase [Alphaproteobacteria bacterium RIFCSPHIGHO2_12_FULL_63_12]|nr:MAG: glycerol-3-phosphate dehydrogenase [Alphaproteobacteria bacterium RIFCSPHIGHO2_12_FULL_63_12]
MTASASPFRSAAIIGGGAWGTALASLVAANGVDTLIWALEPETATAINQDRENRLFLPGVRLPASLRATSDLAATGGRDAYLFVAPAQHARGVLGEVSRIAPPAAPLALCSKGIERATGKMLTEVLEEVWPSARAAVLSGPSFARDVAIGLPTAVTLAAADATLGARWMATIGAPHFRPYLSDDLIGAELGGAVKNVLAIAAGAVEGKGLGDSARAALIARGFAEFQRLGVAMGAKAETMAGLSGLGDLILTATSRQSRNMSLGFELGRGGKIADILAERRAVTEGVATAPAVVAMARRAGVEMPICSAVADLVSGARGLDEIIAALMARPLKVESR